MEYIVLKGYLAFCREHGWKPTFEGLYAFANGERAKHIEMQDAKVPPIRRK